MSTVVMAKQLAIDRMYFFQGVTNVFPYQVIVLYTAYTYLTVLQNMMSTSARLPHKDRPVAAVFHTPAI